VSNEESISALFDLVLNSVNPPTTAGRRQSGVIQRSQTMSESFIVEAEVRADEGKGASRRLRRLEGKMPAIIYGGDKPAQSLSLIRKDFEHMLENEACFSSILRSRSAAKENAIIKDIQRHPAKGLSHAR
jgi:ribosomal protein L25 (general stress protein Ctc)